MIPARGGPRPALRSLRGLALGLVIMAVFPALADGLPGSCDRATLASLGEHYAIAALRHAVASDDADARIVVAQTCKPWPYDENILLAAVAYSQSAPEVAPGERQLGLVVAMFDRDSQRWLSGYTDTLEEDAVTELGEGALWLDTARYDLAPGARAIGVVVHSRARGASCPDRHFNDELRLLVRDGERLRPVLVGYLDSWSLIAGEVCSLATQGAITEGARISIGVENERSHGYADLRLIAQVERTETPPASEGGDDNARQGKRKASRVLHYDGDKYSLDAFGNSFFWINDN